MLTVGEAIEKRQSIRQYKPDAVPPEHIRQMLEAAWRAPSASNSQPWRFLVVSDATERKALREKARCQLFIEQVPVVLVVCADLNTYTPAGLLARRAAMGLPAAPEAPIDPFWLERARERQAPPDPAHGRIQASLNVGIGVEQMVLMATALGLGTCWVGAFNREAVREMFGLPGNIEIIALLPVGYPAEEPPRKPRLPFDQILLRPLEASPVGSTMNEGDTA